VDLDADHCLVAGRRRVAAVAEGPLGVELFDLTDPASPIALGRAATADARAVSLVDGYVLVADAATSFTVIDARDATQPRVVATLPRALGGIPLDVTVRQGGDVGVPAVAQREPGPAARALTAVAQVVAARMSVRAAQAADRPVLTVS